MRWLFVAIVAFGLVGCAHSQPKYTTCMYIDKYTDGFFIASISRCDDTYRFHLAVPAKYTDSVKEVQDAIKRGYIYLYLKMGSHSSLDLSNRKSRRYKYRGVYYREVVAPIVR